MLKHLAIASLVLVLTGCAAKQTRTTPSDPAFKRFVVTQSTSVYAKDENGTYGRLQLPMGFVLWAKVKVVKPGDVDHPEIRPKYMALGK